MEIPEDAPRVLRYLTGPWHWRHPRLFVGIELLVSVWVMTVGVLLCADGYWEGVFFFVAVALILWFLWLFERAAIHSR